MTRAHVLVVAALVLPLSGCTLFGSTNATWNLQGEVSAESTSLTIGVQRAGCANGVTGDLLDPVVTYETRRILISARVAPNGLTEANCPENEVVTQSVQLSEPVGQRDLVDALCLTDPYSSYSWCTDGGVRWSPGGSASEEFHLVRIDVTTWLAIDAVLDDSEQGERIRQAGLDAAAKQPELNEDGWPAEGSVLKVQLVAGDRQFIVGLLKGAGQDDTADLFGAAWDA